MNCPDLTFVSSCLLFCRCMQAQTFPETALTELFTKSLPKFPKQLPSTLTATRTAACFADIAGHVPKSACKLSPGDRLFRVTPSSDDGYRVFFSSCQIFLGVAFNCVISETFVNALFALHLIGIGARSGAKPRRQLNSRRKTRTI